MRDFLKRPFSRRAALKLAGAGLLASQLSVLEGLASSPNRLAMAAGARHEALRAGLESLLHRGPELPFPVDSITR